MPVALGRLTSKHEPCDVILNVRIGVAPSHADERAALRTLKRSESFILLNAMGGWAAVQRPSTGGATAATARLLRRAR
jgi:hypothetical protein